MIFFFFTLKSLSVLINALVHTMKFDTNRHAYKISGVYCLLSAKSVWGIQIPGHTAQRDSIFSHFVWWGSNGSAAPDREHIRERQPTLLTLCVVDTQAEQWRPLAPQQSDVTGGQVQLKDGGVHVLRPEDEIAMMRDPERMVQLFPVVHHLQHEANILCNQKIRGSYTETLSATKKINNLKQGLSCLNMGSEII